ncbi:MAG TPA: hypothetical protein VGD67_05205 [Pseudonocardiaceae bacterium]
MARFTITLAALAVAAVGLTVPASADPAGIVRVGASSALNSSDKTFTANCPPGTVVTGGGGFIVSPTTDHQGFLSLDRLEPLDNGSGFTAAMREVAPHGENWRLGVDATCVTIPAGYDVVPVTAPLNTQIATASCGAKNLIGVGGRINLGLGDVVLDSVTPSADLKSVSVRGTPVAGSGAAGWSVTAFAVCANVGGLQRTTPAVPLSSTSRKTLGLQSCPAGTALYSAGAAVSPGSGQVFLSAVHVLNVDQFSLAADEDHDGYDLNWALLGYGICGA